MGANDDGSRMTYGNYLQIEKLLSLQDGPEGHDPLPCNDEMHFIVVHQAFELWFKIVIRELKEAHILLSVASVPEEDIPKIVHHLQRCVALFDLMAQQWKVMETLTPQDFLSFRDRLGTSSGFESWQMRAVEMLLGLESSQRIGGMDPMIHFEKLLAEGTISSDVMADLKTIDASPSLNETMRTWLSRTPVNAIAGDKEVLNSYVERHLEIMKSHGEQVITHMVDIGHGEEESIRPRIESGIAGAEEFLRPDGEIDAARVGLLFIESYRELPLLAWPRRLLDTIVELEESMLLFRSHHARMVERMIGRRMGTGGSSGVDYLDMTLKYRIFTDLWAVRTILVKRELLDDVDNPQFYGFAA
jgi:tryptophan 2,3-dioxygenase